MFWGDGKKPGNPQAIHADTGEHAEELHTDNLVDHTYFAPYLLSRRFSQRIGVYIIYLYFLLWINKAIYLFNASSGSNQEAWDFEAAMQSTAPPHHLR